MEDANTQDDRLWRIESRAVGVGGAAGFLAGIGMGLVLQFGTGLMPVLGAFAGATSAVRGWLVHLVISVSYGVFFAAFLAYPAVRRFVDSVTTPEYVLIGVVYGTMVAAVTIGLLPFVLELPWVTDAASASFRNVPGPGLGSLVPAALFGVGHLLYGAILGAVYGLVDRSSD